MKKIILAIILIAAVMLGACSSPVDEATEEPVDEGPGLPEVTPAPSDDDTVDVDDPADGSYPGPGEDGGYPAPLLPTPFPPSYPAPVVAPTYDAYPGGVAIIIRPLGVQCEDPLYSNIDDAVTDLEEAGITVQEAGELELIVCDACGCATSEHYRMLIGPDDMATALALGWQRSFE